MHRKRENNNRIKLDMVDRRNINYYKIRSRHTKDSVMESN